jgi:hypothetical protein
MQKPPHQPHGASSDGWGGEQPEDRRSDRTGGNPFGRAFHGPAASSPRSSTPNSSRLDQDAGAAGDAPLDRLPPGFGDLARRVAETNLLVDRAISSMDTDHSQSQPAETLAELGESLNQLFSQLDEGAVDGGTSPWHNITDSLRDLAEKIERREQLRAELQMTQHSIDKAKTRVIDQIQDAARIEQERLSVTRLRSQLAAVMADKLLNKLR